METELNIAPQYRKKEIQQQIRQGFVATGNYIKLDGIFEELNYTKLMDSLRNIKGEMDVQLDKHHYEDLGELSELTALLNKSEFKQLIGETIGKEITSIQYTIKRFKQGDYSLLHDNSRDQERNEFFIMFAGSWNNEAGGQLIYTDNNERTYIFPVNGNSIGIIQKDPTLQKFVKYINHKSEKKTYYLIEGWAE